MCGDGKLLLQEVAVLVDERDELLQRVESADSVFHEQHQRFSEVLVLLSKTLAIPDSMLLQLSEPDVHEFALGLDQVWCLQILYCRMKLHSCKRTSGVLWLMTVQILTTGEG
jgi:hypothetical protein